MNRAVSIMTATDFDNVVDQIFNCDDVVSDDAKSELEKASNFW